jgi:PAS domain S-box-containing protein
MTPLSGAISAWQQRLCELELQVTALTSEKNSLAATCDELEIRLKSLKETLNQSSFPRLRLDAEGRILDCNTSAAQMLRNARTTLLQQLFHHFIHGEPQANFLEDLQSGIAHPKKFTRSIKLQAGTATLPAQLFLSPITNAQGTVDQFEVELLDQSKYEKLDFALWAAEQNFRELVAANPHPILLKDEEGRWLLANEALLRLFDLIGVDYHHKLLKQFLPKPLDLYPGLEALERAIASACQSARPLRQDVFVPHHNNSLRLDLLTVPLTHPNGSPRGVLALGYDLTERDETEKAIHISEKSLASVFKNTMDALFVLDADFCITELNPSACDLLQKTSSELLGKPFDTSIGLKGAAAQRYRRLLRRGIGGGEWHLNPSPQRRLIVDYRTHAHVLPDIHFIALRDITERRRLEEELLESSEREQRRIGRDLHDGLGQKLTAIEFLTQSLRENIPPELADQQALAKQICQRLRDTITETRALVRGMSPFLHGKDGLQTGLRQLVEITHALGLLQCRFHSPSPVPVKNEEVANHLYRIAQEAINNCLKHSKARHLTVHLARWGHGLQLKITDDGQGLPSDPVRATGMGLRLMKHRAALLGAELEINSAAGEGVHLSCTLPSLP